MSHRTCIPAAAVATWAALVSSVFLSVCSAQSSVHEQAFEAPLEQGVPYDPSVRQGRLENGLRYFIRENREPANRVEFRLVVNAGSILEDEEQRGVAHFLEHMAFNGTANFEKQSLVDFMESAGMRLGRELNASTSFDETVYVLTVPTEPERNVETAVQILEDWAHAVTLDAEQVDRERSIVIEELRLGRNARSRADERHGEVLYRDSRYAVRRPIGTLESIEKIDVEMLRRFYRDWYRPDLMAVIAVGDFDASRIESLVKDRFAKLRTPPDARPRPEYRVPEHEGTRFSIVTDPEVTEATVSVYLTRPRKIDPTIGGIRQLIVESLVTNMLSRRVRDVARDADAPLHLRLSFNGPTTRTTETAVLTMVVPEQGIRVGLETLAVELERVARFGFTESELEREKLELLRRHEREYLDRENRPSSRFAAAFQYGFLSGTSIPSPQYEHALYERFVLEITLDDVDRAAQRWIRDAGRVVTVTAPQKHGLAIPGEAELAAALNDVANAEINPYVDESFDAPLLAVLPTGSEVVATREKVGGVTEWDLANGIRVVLKPTDFDADEVVFRAFSPGGTSLASDEDFFSARALGYVSNGGVGALDAEQLEKALAGKSVQVAPFISEFEEGLSGRASPRDLETMFQLIYLRFTAPRADDAAFSSALARSRSALENRRLSPTALVADAYNRLMTGDHPRRRPTTIESLDRIDLARAFAAYKERFADASDYTFVFVGAFEPETLRPLVERYLGSLPATGRVETWRDIGIRLPRGINEEIVYAGADPVSLTRVAFTGPFESASQTERALLRAMAQLLDTRLRNLLRTELGGTYAVNAAGDIVRRPEEAYVLSIGFASAPERSDELKEAVFADLSALAREGPSADEVADVREAMLRAYEQDLKRNSYWLSSLEDSYHYDAEPGSAAIQSYGDAIAAITPAAIRDGARRYLDMENYVRVTLMPASYGP